MLDYDLECRNGIFFLRVKGSLTKETSQKLNSYLIPMIIKNGVKYLVYNLFDLNSIDSLGYEALKECKTAIKFNNGKIYYCNIPNNLTLTKTIKKSETRDELTAMRLLGV